MRRFVRIQLAAAIALCLIAAAPGLGFQDKPATPTTPPPKTNPAIAETKPESKTDTKADKPAKDNSTAPKAAPSTTKSPDKQPPKEPAKPVKPAKFHAETGNNALISAIGLLDPASGYKMEVKFIGWGGSIYFLRLTDYKRRAFDDDKPAVVDLDLDADGDPFDQVNRHTPIPTQNHTAYKLLQQNAFLSQSTLNYGKEWVYPYQPGWIEIDKEKVFVDAVAWELESPGRYSLRIMDRNEKPVIKITRQYTLKKESYVLHCAQQFENLTDQKHSLVWDQFAHRDLEQAAGAYVGRQATIAYRNLSSANVAEHSQIHLLQKTGWRTGFMSRDELVTKSDEKKNPRWKDIEGFPDKYELVWFASMNRYFSAVTMPSIAPDKPAGKPVKIQGLALQNMYSHLGWDVKGEGEVKDRKLIFTLLSEPFDLSPAGKKGATRNLDLSLYAGPRDEELLATPPLEELGLVKLVEYNLGCICTCQPLAHGLLWLLRTFHTIVRDWGVSIILLVLVVRLILHPITKKSQINMQRMQKQMAAIKPEMDKLKKKYEKDAKKMQAEQAKLFQEKGINPLNMLGCLPMFLQMPIWIALYAMLYFAIELRHESAFWGLFQVFGDWHFLGDLSIPDRFFTFSDDPLYINFWIIKFDYSSFNILPILMGVVFYFQQKLTTPPATDEKQAQQQKAMKIIPFIFPIFMYPMPCGLNLYILASTAAGILDSYIVRRHIKKEEEAGTLLKKKEPKKGGFRDRLSKALENQRENMESRDKNLRGGQSKRHGGKRKKKG